MDFDNTEAVNQLIALPPPPPAAAQPKTSVWSAVPRALAAGAAETGAVIGELVKGYGQVSGQMGDVSAAGMFSAQSPAEKAQSEAARQDLLTNGVKGGNDISDSLRNVAEGYRPDPQTASTAENVVFGLTKGLSKAVGYTVAAGPFGAIGFGLDQGATTLDDLQRKGVDQGTALGVAAIDAGVNAASLLLPAVGQTVKGTIGLTLAGGPAAYIAQQAVTSKILKDANYEEIAKQYDPLDPVGLALATLIPAAFGGAHIAGMARSARATHIVPPDAVDAAMVHNLSLQEDIRASDPTRAVPEPPLQPPRSNEVPPAIPEPKVDEELAAMRQRVKPLEEAHADIAAALDTVRKEAKEGTDSELGHADADLLRVAAECALSL